MRLTLAAIFVLSILHAGPIYALTFFKTPGSTEPRRVASVGGPPPRADVLSTVGETEDRTRHPDKAGFDKRLEKDFFPVPVIESRPDEGITYGLMPVLLLSNADNKAIRAIFAALGQYNSVTRFGGAGVAYFYPDKETEIQFYGEIAQKFYREANARYFNPHLGDCFFVETEFIYLKTPFGRFFGLGADRLEDDQSNFVAENFLVEATGGYYFLPFLRANYSAKFHSTDLQGRAISDFADTLTTYGVLPQVADSANFIHEISVVFDNRENREFSEKGIFAKGGYFFSLDNLGSDRTFHGWNLENSYLIPTIAKKMTTAFRFALQQIYGDETPFYEMSSLGGPLEMRAFTPGRFVDRGKIIFQVEERIRLLKWKLFGIPFEIHTDPFFELGRVFADFSDLNGGHWQPVAGLGFRLKVPPNVVARIDLAYGSDGFEIYTMLGYPF